MTTLGRTQNLTQINVGPTSNGFPVTVALVEKPRAAKPPLTKLKAARLSGLFSNPATARLSAFVGTDIT